MTMGQNLALHTLSEGAFSHDPCSNARVVGIKQARCPAALGFQRRPVKLEEDSRPIRGWRGLQH